MSSQLGAAELGKFELGGLDITDTNVAPAPATFTYTPGTPVVSFSGGLTLTPAAAALTYSMGTPTITFSGTINLHPAAAVFTYTPGVPVIYPFPVRQPATSPSGNRDIVSQLNIRMYAQQLRSGQSSTVQSTSQFTALAFDRIQDNANTLDERLRKLSGNVNSLGLTRDPAGNIEFQGATFTVRAGNQVFELFNGRMIFGVANTPPNDSDIPNQQVSIWLDEGGSQLVFRVRLSDGTLKTGVIALV